MRILSVLLLLVFLGAPVRAQMHEEPLNLTTANGTLSGTLCFPPENAQVPVALIIAGSGPTDRDGNNPGIPGANNSLKLVAEGLAGRGIASLRYDKRGVGLSVGAGLSESSLRFDNYVDDAHRWAELLAHDKRFTKVFIIGHSEGSLIGIDAAQMEGPVRALVSLEGAGRPADQVIHEQIAARGTDPSAMARIDEILKSLVAKKPIEVTEDGLQPLFRASVQPYVISWFAHNPQTEISHLRIPVLIVVGTTDLQTPVSESDLLAKADRAAKRLTIEGMNHVLKIAPAKRADNIAAYSNPALPLAPGLIDGIVNFLREVR